MESESKRPGRPPIYSEKMRECRVTLDQDTIAAAKERGQGNLSRGIRAAFNPRQVACPDAPETPGASPPGESLPPRAPI